MGKLEHSLYVDSNTAIGQEYTWLLSGGISVRFVCEKHPNDLEEMEQRFINGEVRSIQKYFEYYIDPPKGLVGDEYTRE